MIFIKKNAFGDVVCKMLAILLKPHCVNTFAPQQAWPLMSDDWIIFKENISILICIH